jgi:hypothetical protein
MLPDGGRVPKRHGSIPFGHQGRAVLQHDRGPRSRLFPVRRARLSGRCLAGGDEQSGDGHGRLTGLPDVSTSIQDMFVSGDKLAVALIWRGTHAGPYGGVAATGKPVEVRDTAIWHLLDGKVTEILTLQDQFGILKQIGYLPESIYAA